MNDEHTARLERIESALAHLERHYEQLNEVVIEHGRSLARIQSLLQRLGQTVENIELDRIKSTNPKPPHYQ
ncbi:MAG: SlyX family protein [Verrucomicrobia bacterium]|nr:SlyX family protein [Verrucomicrobiota bacterium]